MSHDFRDNLRGLILCPRCSAVVNRGHGPVKYMLCEGCRERDEKDLEEAQLSNQQKDK